MSASSFPCSLYLSPCCFELILLFATRTAVISFPWGLAVTFYHVPFATVLGLMESMCWCKIAFNGCIFHNSFHKLLQGLVYGSDIGMILGY